MRRPPTATAASSIRRTPAANVARSRFQHGQSPFRQMMAPTRPCGARQHRGMRVTAGGEPVNTFLVPDISGGEKTSKALLRAAQVAADAMSTGELLARAAAEIGGTWLLAWLLKTSVARLGEVAMQNAQQGLRDVDDPDSIPDKKVSRLVIESGISAVSAPLRVLMPLAAAAHTLRIVSLTAQILGDGRTWGSEAPKHLSRHITNHIMGMLQRLDISMLDLSQIAIVVFTIWFLVAWKENLVDLVLRLEKKKKDLGQETGGLERALLPLSSLAGWGLITTGALMVLHVLGLNIQPLLTVGGVGGLAIGFGAQSVTSNAISGLNLFLTRPFIVGDRVELKTTGGGSVLLGTVEKIDVMRTIVRSDKGVPVAVPNRSITEMIVSNESRLGNSLVIKNFANPRQFSTSIQVKYDDLPKAKAILAEIDAYLKSHPGVDKRLPHGATLAALQDSGVQIGVTAHTTPLQSSSYGNFSDEVMWKLVDIAKKHKDGPATAGASA